MESPRLLLRASICAVFVACALTPTIARAHTVAHYPIPSGAGPAGIAAGPDGNLWFADGQAIGKVTPGGTFTEYPIPSINYAAHVATGPDGNLWFTEGVANMVGNVTTSGTFTEYAVPTANSGPNGITAGPDGNLWFTETIANKIGKVTPGGTFTEYAIPTANSHPFVIAVGPDGNLWFTESNGNKIGKVTPSGAFTEYTVPTAGSQPYGITAGPDGNLWFTEMIGGNVGKVTVGGTFTEYALPTPSTSGFAITAGPDGNLWVVENLSHVIARVTPSGAITEYPIATSGTMYDIITGSDGNLWFTEVDNQRIGKLTPNGPLCGAAPASGCLAPAVARKASVSIKAYLPSNSLSSKNKMTWKWIKGAMTTKVPDFGTPLTTTDYQLCIYDGTSSLVGDAFVPAGGMCGAQPCWTDKPTGFKFKNRDGSSSAGIQQILLKEGAAEKAKIIVKGKGGNLFLPTLPVAQPVTIQLLNSNGTCWEAIYSTPKTNTAGPPGKFSAKAD